MDKWEGKVAIVTGASSGIGAAIVEKLVQHGLKVVGLARRRGRTERLSQKLEGGKGELFPVKCDITNEAEVIKCVAWAVENLGPISVLVNNAGVYKHVDLTASNSEDFKIVWNTNVVGLTVITREVFKAMKENKICGHIINISSVAGYRVISGSSAAYSASKFALRALSEAMRLQMNENDSKTKITCISPGVVDTEMINIIPEDIRATMPMLKAEDVADAAIYVLSTPLGVQVDELIIKPVGEVM